MWEDEECHMRPTGKKLRCKSGPNIEGLATLDSIYSDGRDQLGDGQRGCCHPTVGLLLSENSFRKRPVGLRFSCLSLDADIRQNLSPVTSIDRPTEELQRRCGAARV